MPTLSPITVKMYENESGHYTSILGGLLFDVNNLPLYDVDNLRLIAIYG